MFLALHPTLDLKALTVCANGFATAHGGPANMQRVLSLIGREDVPVSVGVHEGLSPITNFPLQWRVEIDRFYEAQELPESSAALSVLDSPALIAKTLKESKTAVAVLVTGSATNLAIALRKEPDLVGRISAIDAGRIGARCERAQRRGIGAIGALSHGQQLRGRKEQRV